jgi:hypothetical protein
MANYESPVFRETGSELSADSTADGFERDEVSSQEEAI